MPRIPALPPSYPRSAFHNSLTDLFLLLTQSYPLAVKSLTSPSQQAPPPRRHADPPTDGELDQ